MRNSMEGHSGILRKTTYSLNSPVGNHNDLIYTAIYLVFILLLWLKHGSNNRTGAQYRVYFYIGSEFNDRKKHFPQEIREKMWKCVK
jgi:hypothetical protein